MSFEMMNKSLNGYPDTYKFNSIDIFKFICVLLVCMIHITPFKGEAFSEINFWLQNCVCRIAVPFYFVSSGFLLFRKIDMTNIDEKRIREYCFKMLRLLGTWYFLLVLGNIGHLWYLGALVLAVFVLNIFIKCKIPLMVIGIISLIMYLFGLLGDSYFSFLEPLSNNRFIGPIIQNFFFTFTTSRNGLFFGLIYVWMGVCFSQWRILMNNCRAIIGLVLSVVALVLEVYMLKSCSVPKDYNMFVSLLPVTFFLFYIVCHINTINNDIYLRIRRISVIIYFVHLLVYFVVWKVLLNVGQIIGYSITNIKFLMTVLVSLLIGLAIERLSRKDRFKFLQYLYS